MSHWAGKEPGLKRMDSQAVGYVSQSMRSWEAPISREGEKRHCQETIEREPDNDSSGTVKAMTVEASQAE